MHLLKQKKQVKKNKGVILMDILVPDIYAQSIYSIDYKSWFLNHGFFVKKYDTITVI